jgi:hypothetical protein
MVDGADWFRFEITGLPTPSLDLEDNAVSVDTSNGRLYLDLFDAAGALLPVMEVNDRISVESLPLGTYYVRVTGWSRDYDLTIDAPQDDDFEDNDTRARAYDLGTSPDRFDASLADGVDWYRFTTVGFGDEHDKITVQRELPYGQALVDVGMRLYNLGGHLIGSAHAATGDVSVSLDGLKPGTYDVEVYGSPNAAYEMEFRGPRDDMYEDNDTQSTAHDLGTLFQYRDVGASPGELADAADWYSFTLQDTESNFVAWLRFSHDQGNLDLEIYDENGALLGRSRTNQHYERVELQGLTGGRRYYARVYSSSVIDVGPGLVEDLGSPQFNPDYSLQIQT